MPRYVIERNLPGAGRLTPEQLQSVAQRSRGVLKELGSDIQWARRGGFPADRISEVRRNISPLTAEEADTPDSHP